MNRRDVLKAGLAGLIVPVRWPILAESVPALIVAPSPAVGRQAIRLSVVRGCHEAVVWEAGWDRPLTPDEVDRVFAYLADRYNVTLNRPG